MFVGIFTASQVVQRGELERVELKILSKKIN
jgi:hypothetical protein